MKNMKKEKKKKQHPPTHRTAAGRRRRQAKCVRRSHETLIRELIGGVMRISLFAALSLALHNDCDES
jgi:hypothetical protein